MKLYVVDECNVSYDDKLGFFIYGGIVVPEDEIRPLAQGILAIKREFSIPKGRPIKWNNERFGTEPALPVDVHRQIKDRVLDLFAGSGAKIIVCLSPQEFYIKRTFVGLTLGKARINPTLHIRTQEYALNATLRRFNHFLREEDELGMVFADRYADSLRSYMDDHCFNIFPSGAGRFSLERIVYPVIQMTDEFSQLHQLNDIVLGAIQYSLKELTFNFLPRISANFWRGTAGDDASIVGRGFDIYPKAMPRESLREGQEKLRQKFIRRIAG